VRAVLDALSAANGGQCSSLMHRSRVQLGTNCQGSSHVSAVESTLRASGSRVEWGVVERE